MIIKDNNLILQSINTFQMYNHIVPRSGFNLFELDIMFSNLNLAIFPHLYLHPVSVVYYFVLSGNVNHNLVFIQSVGFLCLTVLFLNLLKSLFYRLDLVEAVLFLKFAFSAHGLFLFFDTYEVEVFYRIVIYEELIREYFLRMECYRF